MMKSQFQGIKNGFINAILKVIKTQKIFSPLQSKIQDIIKSPSLHWRRVLNLFSDISQVSFSNAFSFVGQSVKANNRARQNKDDE